MNEEKKISELIEKFVDNSISREELQLLFRYLNENENSFEIDTCFRERWNNNKNSFNIEPEHTWNKIKDRIAEDKTIKVTFKKTVPKIVYRIMEYAAVVALFLVVSWFLHGSDTNKTNLAGEAYTEYIVPYGSKSTVILPDGTKVHLNSGSKIKYTGDFIHSDRVVFLEGEAFFDVTHREKVPFVVKTSQLNIRVYGTTFNVKSFQEEKNIETTLVSGSIVIEKVEKNGNVTQNIKVKPNQIITYLKADNRFLLKTSELPNDEKPTKNRNIQNPGPENTIQPIIGKSIAEATSWINNKLTFRCDSINELISKLQRWYDVKITLKNNNLNESTFTGTFDNETIEQALNALKLTTSFSYTIDKNIIVIY